MGEEVEEVLGVVGRVVVGGEDGDGDLAELLEVHVAFFVLVVDAGEIAVDVEVFEEEVVGFEGVLLPGVDSEDQVDPVMQVGRDVLALEQFAHPEDVLVLVVGPPRQRDVVDDVLVLARPQVVLVPVFEELGEVVELGDELLEVAGAGGQRLEAVLDAVEEAVGEVELVALQLEVLGGEGVHADQEVAHDGRVGVEAAVEDGLDPGNLVALGPLEVLLYVVPLGLAELAGGQREVSEVVPVAEEGRVQLGGRVVHHRPREHVVLGEVVEAPAGQVVEAHQVLEVADFALLPHLLGPLGLLGYLGPAHRYHLVLLQAHQDRLAVPFLREREQVASASGLDLQRQVVEQVPLRDRHALARQFLLKAQVLPQALL